MDLDVDLLFRYRAGECTPEERERFERWVAADPRHRELFEATVTAAGEVLAELRSERARVPAARASVGVRGRAAPAWSQRVQGRRRTWALPVAAGVALAAGVSAWRAVAGPASGAGAMQVTSTGPGQRATVELRDGTQVVLGVASTLRYPASFGARSRDVSLTGEAYFDVVHDEGRPFVVRAGGAVAEDLGTAFVVRAYPDDARVRVVVAEGKVALRAAAPAADAPAGRARATAGRVLGRGELGELGADGATTVRRVNPAAYLAWTEGRLVFDAAPLSEVLGQLERWYDVEFQLADPSLAGRDYSGAFGDASLRDVLDVISAAVDMRYEQRGRTVVLYPRADGQQQR